ncbi:MAG: glycosyltransferase family 9 protein, partial [Ignavibacteria bacterium]
MIEKLHQDKDKIKKILVLKLRGIGDVVLATSAIKNLSDYFTNASIDIVTERPSDQLLKELPFINEVIHFNRKSTKERIKLAFALRKNRYDFVVDFFSNPSTAQLTAFSRAKFRAGFPYKGRKYAYNLFGPEERGKYHAAELHHKFLELLNIPVNSRDLMIGLKDEDNSFAKEIISQNIQSNKRILGISPSGGWDSKKCEPEKFAEFAEVILNNLDWSAIILWGPGDFEDAVKIKNILGDKAFLAPNTTISQMAALLKNCDAIIANDSGPMHIATAVGTPVLSIHGPTSPTLQGPYGNKHSYVRLEELDCIECNLLVCNRKHECFMNLPKDIVYDKFK